MNILQNYYGLAIKDEENRGNVVKMQDSVYASLLHVSSTDENPMHEKCPMDSWCKFGQDGFKHRHGLPSAIVDLLMPIYDDLASPDLLSRCMHGKTQNVNECLNGMIWQKCPKEVFVGRQTIEEGVYSAIAHFNDGNQALVEKLKLLGIVPGYFTKVRAMRSNSLRVSHSVRKVSNEKKSRRQILRAERKKWHDRREEIERNTYECGGH